ncbi:peroxidase family protein [Candidatus Viadribacter manganicus]|uniref:Cadherin domain-containing protein n=1 Tax=Candidatus Viadribacter manganicus TaxID=1759059 RepID=A0A1B1AGQ5_9PROT|nr:peroxidase family protein [Candidatus Viadribacter manganicus]ANP45730.1 hypothetical protein ATE48_07265 [Candidatus Viadribacter manganicus]
MPVSFNRSDLEFLLQQIRMAETGQAPVNVHLPFGLRAVDGSNNNLVPGQSSYGSADQTFPTVGAQVFRTVLVNVDGTLFDPHPGVAGDFISTSYAQTSVDPSANPFADPTTAGIVVDGAPRTISNLIADQSINNPAALLTTQQFFAQLGDGYSVQNTLPGYDPNSLFIGNITPDAGLSAPFNTWMAFFGQFFDHGLDLITKGGSGTVFIPLAPDDPLRTLGPDGVAGTGDEVPDSRAFMVLTRATNQAGADGLLGTADDIHANTNTTTPFVDQNQTYSSHPSHQVFLRQYQQGSDGVLHATGRLLDSVSALDGSHHMPTWADIKANALLLGIILTDEDVHNVPLLATDAYGNFLAGPNGHVQIVVVNADGSYGLVELDPLAPVLLPANVARTDHAFLNDIANGAAPSQPGAGGTHLLADLDNVAGGAPPAPGYYDDELLNAHYVAGDGRANENIGLSAVHDIFHLEHNRLVEQIKALVRAELAGGDSAFALNWVLPGANLFDGIQDNEWNGERLFQAAKFGTETQYQHLVFEEFARKIAPTIHLFGNVDIHLDAAITSEFANAVYRFGHSMLNENMPRYVIGADGTPVIDTARWLDASGHPTSTDTGIANPNFGHPVLNDIGLIEAFLNPLEYAARGAGAAGEIVLGTVNQIGNEIDEFVTGALRNNLLGLPLDLAALNIARGRDTGVPPLNLLRAQLYVATQDTSLKPYSSWAEFGAFLKHAASLINFVAAYGTHASVSAATTMEQKRAAALDLVIKGLDEANKNSTDAGLKDAYDFMHSLGAYANDLANPLSVHATWSTGSITGVDTIDLWIGGLAEKQNLFGGLLGSTFNFIFETQLENLQDGDRFYYLPRIEGLHWGAEIEGNSFASMIMANTGIRHLPASIFLTPEYVIEASTYFVRDADGNFVLDGAGNRIATDASTWLRNPVTGALLVEVLPGGAVHFIGDDNFFGNTIVLGGTEGNDWLMAGNADDDTVWGDGGDDIIDGGNGNDQLFGGDGNDLITDTGGNDIIHGEAGNDQVFAGAGDDIVFGGDGADIIDGGMGFDAISGGTGNDIIRGGEDDDELIGNEGDDWIEGGLGGDLMVGDAGAPTGQVPLYAANDVLIGGAGGDRMQGFSGDDIMLGLGGFDTFDGRLGFDWASFEQETQAVSADLSRAAFIAQAGAPAGDAIRDVFIETEGVSGTRYNDILLGSNPNVLDPLFNALTNVNLIFGLQGFFAPGAVNFSGGNIMLGGDGSDFIMGRGGNDIIDGDAWLHVELTSDGQIFREIRTDITTGDVDVAVYNDVFANYTISGPDAQGFYTVSHNQVSPGVVGLISDGVDRVRNIERLQFLDQTVVLDQSPNANRLPTGAIQVTDLSNLPVATPVVGQPLSFTSNIGDPDGIVAGSMHYQWQYLDPVAVGGGQPVWVDITGATGAEFIPTLSLLGEQLRVVATYTDGLGFVEHVNSNPTNLVLQPTGVNTAPFVVQQQGLVGLPDTAARAGAPINLFLPLTQVFGDNETASSLLHYTATLANGAALSTVGLTFTLLSDGLGGVTGAVITGVLTTPGPVSITVHAADTPPIGSPPTPLTVTDTFVINVLQGNRAPVAGPTQIFLGSEDVQLVGQLSSASDPDGDQIAYRLVTNSAQHGAVTFFDPASGVFAFQGSEDYAGPASFQYYVTDGALNSAPVTVTINLAPVNDGAAPFTMTGSGAVGQVVTALIGVDPDGPWDPALAVYRWFRDGVLIDGAVGADYLIQLADQGHVLSVEATYVDAQGFSATVMTGATAPIGRFGFGPLAGVATPTLSVFSTLVDPDGAPLPEAVFIDWEVSADGLIWDFAPFGRLSADGTSLTQPNATSQFVRATMTYIDGMGNLEVVTSDPMRVTVGGSSGATFNGGADRDIIYGLGGVDTLNGGAGDDIIIGGLGSDNMSGGDGNDEFIYLIGDGADAFNGGAGFDALRITGTSGGETLNAVVFNGALSRMQSGTLSSIEMVFVDLGGGIDTLSFASTLAGSDVSVSLLLGMATGFSRVVGVENVTGGAGNDTLGGDDANNIIRGGAGNDAIFGGLGADTLLGEGGNDRFIASVGDGDDAYTGGAGVDTLDLSGTSAGANVNLITGLASSADIGADTLATIENIIGGSGADVFVASTVRNIFTGGAGADVFTFQTRQGAGNGAANRDIITDFVHLSDRIDISAIDADTRGIAAANGVQHFIFDGFINAGAAAVGHIGYHYETVNGVEYTVIEANVRAATNGDTTMDFQIALEGHLTLTSADFILGGG